MGIMGYLRERMGKIVAIVIGFSLVAFIATEVINQSGSFLREDNSNIGEVAGQKIPYDKFNESVEQNANQFKQQSGQSNLTSQITSYIQENTWNEFVSKAIIAKEANKLGLTISPDEAQAMTSGSNPSPQVIQAFTDPQTGTFDIQNLNQSLAMLKKLPATDPKRQQWDRFVESLLDAKKAEKYMAIVTNGLYVNSLDAKDDYEAKNKLVNFKYTALDYASLQDSKVTLTDADYSSYYDEHKGEFKNAQELRSIDYVSFNAAPSKDDSAAVKAQIEKLKEDFKASTTDSLFVQINSETKVPFMYKHKGQLGPELDSVMFKAAPGFVYGPYMVNGNYTIAKLIDSRVGPDSVKAKHILLSPMEGGVEKAMAKADSIKKLLQAGKSFEEMAKMYSMDPGSAAKGGELGTFGRGAMIPVFEDAVFNGQKGEYKIVSSQMGVHLIYIEDQKGSSKVVKLAIVDKPLAASSKTQSVAYSKAQAFLIALGSGDFDADAKKSGLQSKKAEDISGVASSLPGLDNARDVVRWAFKAKKGDVYDQVFTVGNEYIVARLSTIKPKGTLSLDDVKKQIEPLVRNEVKGKLLADKLQAALNGSSTIDQVAQKAGSRVNPVQNIVFANPIIPGAAAEYKVVGTIFGSKVNKLSKPVIGQQGVYVFVVDNFINPAPLTNAVRQKQQIGQALMQRSQGQILEALKDKSNVKDYRARLL